MSPARTLLVAVVVLAPLSARATEDFPSVVERELSMTYGPPPCSVCHLADVQARYSVDTSFGQALRDRGVVAYDQDSLRRALDSLRQHRVDSDGDGISDVDELVDGTDPNLPEGLDPVGQVRYGCVVSRGGATAGATSVWPLLAVSLLGVAAARRRRARGR